MKICFVVDARSPIAKSWIEYFINSEHAIHIISTYPCEKYNGVESFTVVPIAFSWLTRIITAQNTNQKALKNKSYLDKFRAGTVSKMADKIRHILSPFELLFHINRCRKILDRIEPDIVHAMRLPYEGIFTALVLRKNRKIKFCASIWGNDFTLFANKYALIAWLTKVTLKRADFLHADCERDINLAKRYGFTNVNCSKVAPGAGGVKMHEDNETRASKLREKLQINEESLVVLNPRGMRHYVRNDIFFKAIAKIIMQKEDVMFVGLAMAGNSEAERWVNELGISGNVRLLPKLAGKELIDIYTVSDIMVSPSMHDGTPNTLLECMSHDSLPVVGNIDSIREWIIDEWNGYLFDPTSVDQLTSSVLKAINNPEFRRRANKINKEIIIERANYNTVMPEIESMYYNMTSSN